MLTSLPPHGDHAAWLPVDLPSLLPGEGRVRGVAVPERLYSLPTAGLAPHPSARLPQPAVQRLLATLRSIFD